MRTIHSPDQHIVRTAQASTGIPGYTPQLSQPKVDLFKENGGYGGLIGLQGPLAPGSYKLSDILHTPTAPQTPVVPQYSQAEATHDLSQQLAGIANTGGTLPQVPAATSPLSPTNPTNNTKGPATPNYLQNDITAKDTANRIGHILSNNSQRLAGTSNYGINENLRVKT